MHACRKDCTRAGLNMIIDPTWTRPWGLRLQTGTSASPCLLHVEGHADLMPCLLLMTCFDPMPTVDDLVDAAYSSTCYDAA